MLQKQVSGLTAQKLRLLLICSILLLILIGGTAFWYVNQQLTGFANQVRVTAATANASTADLTNLQSLKTQLAEDADTVERTKNIVADSQSYSYQDQIIKDINTYANRAGVTITSYTFMTDTPSAAGGQRAEVSGQSSTKAVAGLKSVGVAIAIKSPVKYTNIMNFIHAIEQNLTKMQLSGISLTKDSQAQTDNITAGTLTIEVYTR